jgi:ATP-dependent Zn protease
MMDKESLELVKEAYYEAKLILTNYKDKLIAFSELLQNNTIVYKKDIVDEFFI